MMTNDEAMEWWALRDTREVELPPNTPFYADPIESEPPKNGKMEVLIQVGAASEGQPARAILNLADVTVRRKS